MRRFMTLAGIAGLTVALSGPVAGAQDDDAKAFCKAALRVENVVNNAPFEDGPDAKEPDPDDVAKFQRKLGKALTKAENTAPSELEDAVETAAAVLRASAESGEEPFEDPEFLSATTTIDEYRYDSCGYEQIEVSATEHEFDGLPDTLDAGTVAIKFTNEGAQIHDLVLFRIKGDAAIEDLFELDEDEAESIFDFRGFTFAEQGETGYLFAKLGKAGSYGAVCFVPEGTLTVEDFETGEGPPHALLGMTAEFTVEK